MEEKTKRSAKKSANVAEQKPKEQDPRNLSVEQIKEMMEKEEAENKTSKKKRVKQIFAGTVIAALAATAGGFGTYMVVQNQANNKLNVVQKELNTAKDDIEAYAQALAESAQTIAAKEAVIAELNALIESTKGELTTAKTNLATVNQTLVAVQAELDVCEQDLEEANALVATKQATIAEKTTTINQLTAQKQALESEVATLQSQIAALTADLQAANALVAEKQAAIETLTSEKAALAATVAEKEEAINALTQANQALESEKQELNARIEELEGTLSSDQAQLQAQIDALNKTIEQNNQTIEGLEADIQTANNTITQKDEQIAGLQTELESANLVVAAKQAEIDSLEGQLATANQTIADKDAQIASLNGDILSLQNSLTAEQAKVATLETRILELEAQIAKLTQEKEELTAQVEELTAINATLNGTIQNLENQIANLQNEIAGLKASASLFKFDGNTIIGVNDLTGVKKLVLPETYSLDEQGNPIDGRDYAVTTIAANAFKNVASIEEVTIPVCITTINTNAFNSCSNLKVVKFAYGTQSASLTGFTSCKIDAVYVPVTVTNLDQSLGNAKELRYGGDVTDWCNLTFEYTAESTVGYGIKTCTNPLINGAALYLNNTKISDSTLTIPSAVTAVKDCTFMGLNLDVLNFENMNIALNTYSFYGMKINSTNYTYTGTDYSITNGVFTTTNLESGAWRTEKRGQLITSVNTTATEIPEDAFAGCYNLREFDFSNTTQIGDNAFRTTGLENVVLPNTVETVGDFAFSYCFNLKTVYTEAKSMGSIINCDNLEKVYFNCEYVGGLKNNQNLKECFMTKRTTTIPSSETAIIQFSSGGAFYYEGEEYPSNWYEWLSVGAQRKGTSVGKMQAIFNNATYSIENNVMSIYYMYDYDYYTNFPDSSWVSWWRKDARISQVTEVRFDKIKEVFANVGRDAFAGFTSLKTIDLLPFITNIYKNAFASSGLESIQLPSGLIGIGQDAFRNCRNLRTVNLNEGLKTIGDFAFHNCTSLTEIVIPGSVTEIGNSAFIHQASALKSVVIKDNSQSGESLTIGNNAFGEISDEFVIEGKRILGENLILSDAAFFGNALMFNSPAISKITANITCEAFDYDNGTLTIKQMHQSTGMPEWYNFNAAIENVVWGMDEEEMAQITTIGANAFAYCYALSSIIIPEGVTSIGANAFKSCFVLAEVYNLSALEIVAGSTDFGGVAQYAKVVHTSANESTRIIEENGVQYYVYDGEKVALRATNKNATTITLAQDCTSINQRAFEGCTGIKTIYIPSSVVSMDGVYNSMLPTYSTVPFAGCSEDLVIYCNQINPDWVEGWNAGHTVVEGYATYQDYLDFINSQN